MNSVDYKLGIYLGIRITVLITARTDQLQGSEQELVQNNATVIIPFLRD